MQKVPYLEKWNLLKKRMIQGKPCTVRYGLVHIENAEATCFLASNVINYL